MADDLKQRCQEILNWKRTGRLVDGAVRRLAASRTEIPEHYRLDIAEKQTADEAMQFVIDGRR